MTVHLANQPDRVYWRGAVTPGDGFLPKDVPADLWPEPTVPAGHPEAFHDAYARLHRFFEADVRKWKAGKPFACDGIEIREHRGRLDGHGLHRSLPQEQREEGRLDRNAKRRLKNPDNLKPSSRPAHGRLFAALAGGNVCVYEVECRPEEGLLPRSPGIPSLAA